MKAWRESACLLVAARSILKSSHPYDYNVLFLKRHQNAKFPGAFVFPGGLIEPADGDLKWKDLFKNHGYSEKSLESLIPKSKNRPEIFQNAKNALPKEISLRISAIRETFEECGILLCNKSSESTASSGVANHLSIPNGELEFWQNKVYSNAKEFYNMCEKLECYPNVWALHEWANWLTPTFYPKSQRYNTAFFFACLPQIPNANLDSKEMEELLWATPDHIMTSFKSSLMPPQHYEILKLTKYKNLDDLSRHAIEQSKNGMQLYFPLKAILRDGAVNLLPGDSMYPVKIDAYNQEYLDKSDITIEKFREISQTTNRIEMFDNPDEHDKIYSKL